jgi:hypothetical protein
MDFAFSLCRNSSLIIKRETKYSRTLVVCEFAVNESRTSFEATNGNVKLCSKIGLYRYINLIFMSVIILKIMSAGFLNSIMLHRIVSAVFTSLL